MGITLNIPEAASLRRAAASLASALSAEPAAEQGLSLDLAARMFFRAFPWTGERRTHVPAADLDVETVGQYFRAFNWEGVPAPAAAYALAPSSDSTPRLSGAPSSAEILKEYF